MEPLLELLYLGKARLDPSEAAGLAGLIETLKIDSIPAGLVTEIKKRSSEAANEANEQPPILGFRSMSELMEDGSKNKKQSLDCDECDKSFPFKIALNKHKQVMHRGKRQRMELPSNSKDDEDSGEDITVECDVNIEDEKENEDEIVEVVDEEVGSSERGVSPPRMEMNGKMRFVPESAVQGHIGAGRASQPQQRSLLFPLLPQPGGGPPFRAPELAPHLRQNQFQDKSKECPLCKKMVLPNRIREHLATSHFRKELVDAHVIVDDLGNVGRCRHCDKEGPKNNIGRHAGLFHNKIMEFVPPEAAEFANTASWGGGQRLSNQGNSNNTLERSASSTSSSVSSSTSTVVSSEQPTGNLSNPPQDLANVINPLALARSSTDEVVLDPESGSLSYSS